MSGAEGPSIDAAGGSAPAAVPTSPGPRGRLFRKYALLFIALVGAALLVTSGFDFWFSYQENKAALVRVQQEKAQAAAARIEEFIGEIERQIGWTTHAQWAAAPLDQRRQDYFRLLRQVPAITELSQLDADGKEQLKVSRLSMDVIGSGTDLSRTPAFKEAKAHRVWFGPVYFRKQSEPYMTLAVRRDGRNAGVTVAEINLKLIWDVITALKIGQQGYAYVVDGRGRLIAHPDISLVLRDTDLSRLPQVAAALRAPAGSRDESAAAATVAHNLAGRAVLTAHAPIQPLGWLVFVEVPLKEAFAPLYGAGMRTALLLLFGLVAAALVALFLARRMTGPIRAIAAGAERIGAGELDGRIEVHTGDELEALAGQFNRMAGDLQKSYAELEQRVRDRTAELSETLEHQTATAEVLGVINASPGDLAPVFGAMLEKALRLCGAAFGMMNTFDGQRFHHAADHGVPPAYAEFRRNNPMAFGAGTAPARIIAGESMIHNVDLKAEATYERGDPNRRALVDLGGARSHLAVALRKDGTLLGHLAVYRREVLPFSEKQIALLQNFAAQAVIAMENARLITETREALEQQTATAEVLGVINSSPGDLAPVFDAILEKAHSLCGAAHGHLSIYDGQHFRAVAMHGMPGRFAELLRQPFRPGLDVARRLLAGESVIHIADMAPLSYAPDDTIGRGAVEIAGVRTILIIALRKEATLLGYLTAHRVEVRPFSDKEIALLQNFAAQAVIAMENARLITETREALEQQTATAEILGVINSSPGELQPVFDAMLEKALRLCDATLGTLYTYDGELMQPAAIRGASPTYAAFLRRGPLRPGGGALGDFVRGQNVHHNPDLKETDAYRNGDPHRRALVDQGGGRALVGVSMRKDAQLLGGLLIYRLEPIPFTDKQIALLQNFAAQAVIAMENARLLTETRERTQDLQESLEIQTAISDVLRVISGSAFDLEPVLQSVVSTAIRLCRADHAAIFRNYDGEFHWAAGQGLPNQYEEIERELRVRPGTGSAIGRAALEGRPVHILDAWSDPLYELKEDARTGGVRTLLGVPLLRDGAVIGVIGLARQRVEAFTEKQIELVATFADQAVIAIENARLLNETREALEQQTATSEVLRVMSSSAFDLDPVLETVVATAVRLCRADQATIYRLYDQEYRWAAGFSLTPEYERIEREFRGRPGTGTLVGRVALTRDTVQIPDAMADALYEIKDDARIGGIRTLLGVPLLREGAPIGVIGLARRRIEPYTGKEIELVRTFADQAVIAVENARLLGELRSRTDELGRSVEELKALSEVGQAVSSTLDLRAVLSTILNRSVDLSGADSGAIFRYRRADRTFRFVEAVGYSEAMAKDVRQLDVGENATGLGIAIANRTPLQIPDLRERPPNPLRDQAIAAGFRSVLIVPLVGGDRIMGATVLQRRVVGEFPEATVRLMQTLAAQSVLAIQNARLFREIEEKSEELRQASLHKSQFLANMSHELRTPLNAILGYTELLADGIYGELAPRAAGVLERVQNNGKHLLALINDVLDLAKIEAGQLSLTLEDYAMPDVVQSVVSATESLANNKGLTFTADIAPGLPPGHGDSRRLAQVLLNLTGNAIKFTDQGEVAIGAVAESGNFVLTVRDTGPGIAPEDQAKIFEEFQQVDNSNTRKKGGTGLGLAISKRMVEMQGGTISVESEVGRGATFRVTLPVRVEPAAEELLGAAQ